jgi:hypothetical protein
MDCETLREKITCSALLIECKKKLSPQISQIDAEKSNIRLKIYGNLREKDII